MQDLLSQRLRASNSLLNALKIKQEKIILVQENGMADASFMISNLMQQFFAEKAHKTCLVTLHNSLKHYQHIGKRLGYNLLTLCQEGRAAAIDLLDTVGHFDEKNDMGVDFISSDREHLIKGILIYIKQKVDSLLNDSERIYLIIDDVSHLLDLNIEVALIITFVHCCINLNNRVTVVIGCHVSDPDSEAIAQSLKYVADLTIDVSSLKTGISQEVSGVINLYRKGDEKELVQNVFHYKTFEREVKTFVPGAVVHRLCN